MAYVPRQVGWMDSNCVTQSSYVQYDVSNEFRMGFDFIFFFAVHVYLISKFGAEEETSRWDNIYKKLNSHIRYKRSAAKKKHSSV